MGNKDKEGKGEGREKHFSEGTGHPILGSFLTRALIALTMHTYNVIHKNKKQYDSARDGRQDVPDAREP